jgi:hypothetical protein
VTVDAADETIAVAFVLLALFCVLGWIFDWRTKQHLKRMRAGVEEMRQIRDSIAALAADRRSDDPLHTVGFKPAGQFSTHIADLHLEMGVERAGELGAGPFWVSRCSCGAEFHGVQSATAKKRRKEHADAVLAEQQRLVSSAQAMREGRVKKGGVGAVPLVPRPEIRPAGQGGVAGLQ